ncbi:MAG TPA: class I tRNA ligase family protein, partial [Patescibacteria group bacterium]|nr:class I tRNA ligase family protein [Patescibacteria group bacterium]
KVTPAHDPVDFEIGARHNLVYQNATVIGFDDRMTAEAFEFAGLHKLEARKKVIEKLGKLIEKEEPYTHRVGHCERCKTVIEPLISLQWFISMKPLAKPAMTAVQGKKTAIIPKRFEKTYFQWLENIHDWCVSRQLWWGPQLPIWYCGLKGLTSLQKTQNPDLVESSTDQNKGCGEVIASLEKPTIPCPKCGKKLWIQDPDTFDTWFLSGQWPYTTLGFEQGIERKKDFQYFYPTSVMETGYEILFFWVARMMMLGLYRTGEVPFKTVYLHGLVRDALGEKMSKSKENVIDPIQVVEKHGADALRMALISGTAPGNDSKLYEEKIVGYRNFANKIWNMGRFLLFNIENTKLPSLEEALKSGEEKDLWLLSELKTTVMEVNKKIEKYRLSEAAQMLYNFLWHKLADIYIEYTKTQVQQGNFVPLRLLLHAFTQGLILLHPFMPFITEEVYLQLPRDTASLMISTWPEGKNGKTAKK